MRIVVTGAGGMLGQALTSALSRRHEVVAYSRQDLDVTRPGDVREALQELEPHWVFHAAAYTQVDLAENQPATAFRVNAFGARSVATAAREVGASVLYYSTDYVFDGTRRTPYAEWDRTSPVNVYGASKLAGENEVRSLCPDHLIVRTSWLFGTGGRHFVGTIIERARQGLPLRVIDDQRGSPTYTLDLAAASVELAERGARGICNVTNSGSCSWFELAREALSVAGLEASLTPVSHTEFPTPARRPAFSVLGHQCLHSYGVDPPPPWQDAVRRFLESEP